MSLSTQASSVNALYTTKQCGGRSCNKPPMKERKTYFQDSEQALSVVAIWAVRRWGIDERRELIVRES